MNAADQAFVTALIFQSIISFVVFFIFCKIRPKYRVAYSPMCFGPNAAELPGDGLFDWIKPTMQYSLDWIHENRGLDTVMYISFLQTCTKLFLVFFIVSLFLLFPVFGTGEDQDLPSDDRDYVEGMDILSMSNVETGSPRYWAPALVLIGFTVAFWMMVYLDHKQYSKFRVQALKAPAAENFVVKISNPKYPEDLTSVEEKKKWLFDYFNSVFPGDVVAVGLVASSPELEKLRIEETLAQRGLERALAVQRKTGATPQHKLGFLGLVGEQVESIPHFIGEINKKRAEALEIMNNKELPLVPVAWVTFKSIRKAQQCAALSLNRDPTAFVTSPAPEPRDVYWAALGTPKMTKVIKGIISLSVTVFICFFYIIPITFVQGLTNLTELSENTGFTWLKPLVDGAPGLVAFLEGALPPIVLIIFMILVIPIFRALTASEAYETVGEQARSVLNKYLGFIIVNIFLVSTLAGAILSKITDVAADPTSIVSVLASSIPAQGNFFMLYIMTKTSGAIISLLNPGRVIVPAIFHRFLSKSEREFREVEAPPEFAYDIMVANDLLIVVLTITYSVMNPLILGFSFVFFALKVLSTRYNVIFAFEQKWDGKGILWPTIFSQTCNALLICQITTIGVLAISQFPGTVILFPLIFFTAIYRSETLAMFFKPSAQGASDESHSVLDQELLTEIQQKLEENRQYPQLQEVQEAMGGRIEDPNETRHRYRSPLVCLEPEGPDSPERLDYSAVLGFFLQPSFQPIALLPQRPSRVAQFRKYQPA